MTPEDLRALADAATPGPWGTRPADPGLQDQCVEEEDWQRGPTWITGPAFVDMDDYGSWFSAADARLIALAPDLARLCADLATIVAKTIYSVPGYTGSDVWWAEESRAALAELAELEYPLT